MRAKTRGLSRNLNTFPVARSSVSQLPPPKMASTIPTPHEISKVHARIDQLRTQYDEIICRIDELIALVKSERPYLKAAYYKGTTPARSESGGPENITQGQNNEFQTPSSSIGQTSCPHPHCAHESRTFPRRFNLERHFCLRMASSFEVELAVITLS